MYAVTYRGEGAVGGKGAFCALLRFWRAGWAAALWAGVWEPSFSFNLNGLC